MVSRSWSSLARTTQAPTGLKRSSTLPISYCEGSPALNVLGGSDRTLGNRKRTVPRSMPSSDAVNASQATLIQLPTIASRTKRRVGPVFAGGLGGAGLGGRAGLSAVAAAGGAAGGVAGGGGPVMLLLGSDMRIVSLPISVSLDWSVGVRPTGNFLVPDDGMSTVFPEV